MAWRAWLQTQQGRYALQAATIGVGFAGFNAYFLPQTYFVDKYKEFVQNYTNGLGTPVAANVKKMYEQVLNDLKVPEYEKGIIDLFTVYGFDLFHAGSTAIRTGAIIGVPVNFSYEAESDVDRRIRVVTKSVNWESKPGEDLRASLVLSEDARKFGLAREVIGSRGFSIWFHSLCPLVAVALTYMASNSLNDRFRFRQHPFRFIMYGLVATFNTALYFAATDITTINVEGQCDLEAAAIGPAYARGGVEFYTKLRERNKALRELMGESGAKQYTTSGNEVAFLRIKTTPLSERVLALEDFIKENNTDDSIKA